MILYIQPHGTEREHFKIMSPEDLDRVYEKYPMTQDIALSCDTLKEAVSAISEYLDGHNMHSWVEEADLAKSIKARAAALGLVLAGSIPHAQKLPSLSVKPSLHPSQVAQHKDDADEFGKHPEDRFLWNIQQIESSGGKNTHHKPIASGKYRGNQAIGQWGLLKPTVSELLSRMRNAGKMTPDYAKLETMSRDQLQDHFKKNPQVELNLARQLAGHVMQRQGGDMGKAAYSWLHGHNLAPANITREKINGSQYVSRYNAVDTVNPFKQSKPLGKIKDEVDNEDFKERVKSWYKRREDYLTETPMRTSNFTPDPGRIRDDRQDEVKPDSLKTPQEKLVDNIKRANERQKQ
jgi:hypothetical protein